MSNFYWEWSPGKGGSARQRSHPMNLLNRFNRSHKKRPAIPEDLSEEIQAAAEEEGISAGEYVRRLLEADRIEHRRALTLPERWERLTRRERQIVRLVCERLTNDEVAYKLGISPATVKSHLRRAMEKLGVHSRFEMIRVLEGWGESGVRGIGE